MPWCPNCKYEYQDGFTVCSDCGVELVPSYEDIERLEELKKQQELAELEAKQQAFAEMMEKSLEEMTGEEAESVPTPATSFVKAKDKADNYKSSGYALTGVGLLGIVFMVLMFFDVIHIGIAANMKYITTITMSVMFLIFLVMGIRSFAEAKKYSEDSMEEEQLDDEIHGWFTDNYTAESIDSACELFDEALEGEMKYFARSEFMKREINQKYGALDDSYVEHLIEELYAELYEC